MPLPHKKTKITTALGRAAKAGIRRAITGPTKQERAKKEAAEVDRFMRERRPPGKKPIKPKPKTPAQERQESATRAIGFGPLLDAFQGKKKKER